jgi:aryl-alcohol dehydrogenase-like predicted oxidoreductase
MKIALGTVQFGLPYGIANRGGQIKRAIAAEILDRAYTAGARLLDTAIAYGEAETVLGEIGAARAGWRIVTKLPALPADLSSREVGAWCRTTVEGALHRLRTDHLEGLLLHRPDDLWSQNGQALADALIEIRHQDRTKAIGISIYGPDDLEMLLPNGPARAQIPLDIVQSPTSVLDRRLETSGWADRLLQVGTRIHLRSVFLQGLLLIPRAHLPAYLSHAAPDLDRWHDWLEATGADPLSVALRFALSREYAECAVLGMDSIDHLSQILAATKTDILEPPADLRSTNAFLLDPRKWTKQ